MLVRALLMSSSVILTIIVPAILYLWLSDLHKLRRHLAGLALGLLLQVISEIVLMSVGKRHWIPYVAAPFVGLRLIQLCLLLNMAGILAGKRLYVFLTTIILNLVVWLLIACRLLVRL
jgi:voltage-gated potassium channel Kch